MSDQDLSLLAAEYALGTLDRDERASFARQLARDPAARAMVADWEARLAPLSSVIPDDAPPPSLLGRIEAELDSRQSGGNVVALRRSIVRWRATTGFASAIAASLAIFAIVRGQVDDRVAPPRPQVAQNIAPRPAPGVGPSPNIASAASQTSGVTVVARSERGGGSGGVTLATGDAGNRGGVSLEPRPSSWTAVLAPVERAGLSADLDSEGVLTVRRLAADAPQGKEIALWLLAPERAPKPLGVLTKDVARFPLQGTPPEGSELAASIEPDAAGAPAQPTAPYAYRGKFVRR